MTVAFGNIPPFFTSAPPATNTTTTAFTGGAWTFTKTAESGVAETIMTWKVSDASAPHMTLKSVSSTDATFWPWLQLNSGGTNRSQISFLCPSGSDSGSTAVGAFVASRDNFALITTRPLFSFWNGSGTTMFDIIPLNSGAQGALLWPASGAANPALTTRSSGNRVILYNAISGTTTDYAIGMNASGPWFTVTATTDKFQFFRNTTEVAYQRGDGLFDTTGTIRATGLTNPSSGAGVEIVYNSGGAAGTIQCYDRTGSAYKALNLSGLSVTLNPNGTTALTASTTAVTCALPLGLKSYTVATLPAATTAGQQIYVSDESGGAVPAFSDGTNWRRVTDRAIVS